jgi:hypothetical protein
VKEVGATLSNSVAVSHTVRVAHSRLDEAVPSAVWYSVLTHVAWSVQPRLDVAVAVVTRTAWLCRWQA